MAIGRINGPMLFSNLERQGVNIAIDGNLTYFDVNNRYVGINTSNPAYPLDSPGNVKLANIIILGNTITSNTGKVNLGTTSNIVITGGTANAVIYTDGLGNLKWGSISEIVGGFANISASNVNVGNLNATSGNITTLVANNFSSTNVRITGGNVTANISGNVTGTFLSLTGNINANAATFSGNVIAPWFLGNVRGNVETISGSITAANLISSNSYINSSAVQLQDIKIVGNTISSTTTDLVISANKTNPNNIVVFDSVSAFDIPTGTTAQRPPNPKYGYLRYNTDLNTVEWWAGLSWISGSNLLVSEVINPDGINATFTLGQSTTDTAILVNINGTIQQIGSGAYTVVGNQITFGEIPLTSDVIEIRYIAGGVAAISWTGGTVSGTAHFTNTTVSTSTTTGAVVVDGGIGIAGNITIGGNINVAATSGTPLNTSTPASWLKVQVGASYYYMPLYQ